MHFDLRNLDSESLVETSLQRSRSILHISVGTASTFRDRLDTLPLLLVPVLHGFFS